MSAPPNTLYYGDNLDILRRYVDDESVDLIYLDPPFNSNADYNVLFAEKSMASRVPAICRPSTVSDDWVFKGFHINVEGIELRVRPGHRRGMIVLKRFFRRDSEAGV